MNRIDFKREVAALVGCTPRMIHVERKRQYKDHGHWIIEVSCPGHDLLKHKFEEYNLNANDCYDEALLILQELETELPKDVSYTMWKRAKDFEDANRR